MPRVKSNVPARKRHKKIIRQAKGYRGGRSRLYRTAREAVERSMSYAFRDRKVNKRRFRSLWVARINAAVRAEGLGYSQFIKGLRGARIDLDRKMLAELAVSDPLAFRKLAEAAKNSL